MSDENVVDPAKEPVDSSSRWPSPKNSDQANRIVAQYLLAKLAVVDEEFEAEKWTQGQRNRLARAKAFIEPRLRRFIKD